MNALSSSTTTTGAAMAASRCAAAQPFAFPFTPLGLNLFDIDPSRILNLLHHQQTWLAEEALRNRGLMSMAPLPKEYGHRYNPLGDLLVKDYLSLHSPPAQGSSGSIASSTIAAAELLGSSARLSPKHQQKQSINLRYPPSTTFYPHHHHASHNHHHHHHLQQTKQSAAGTSAKHSHQPLDRRGGERTDSSSPRQSGSAEGADAMCLEHKRNKTNSGAGEGEHNVEEEKLQARRERADNKSVIVPSTHSEDIIADAAASAHPLAMSPSAAVTSAILYKESLEQLLQRRRSGSSLIGGGVGNDSLRSYSQLLLSSAISCTDTASTSSCKEKSSSSSTSSTSPPPPSLATSALLAASHQHLSQMLNSPSESSSTLFSEPIEEETRCVVCSAHFPNVWLLEQHAALQHPHLGPGDEKPFICEQCGQSYRYRSAYAKHKEQNHRARLPADKLFTCDVCGMQFRYLKSFKKHRLNHALERLHGKKIGPVLGGVGGVNAKHASAAAAALAAAASTYAEQELVSSSQEVTVAADDGGQDLRTRIKREPRMHADDDGGDDVRAGEEQDSTIDSAGMMLYADTMSRHIGGGGGCNNNSNNAGIAATSSTSSGCGGSTEPNISSSDVIHSTNKRPRILVNTPHMETEPSYQHHLQQRPHHQLPPHLHHMHGLQHLSVRSDSAATSSGSSASPHQSHAAAAAAAGMSSLNSLNSITSLINAERLPSGEFLGLNAQEASILNFLRVDAADRQRDKRAPASRFACPFCGKCVRSKENLKLHVRKHTGERPFVCLFCGRAFGGKSDLTRHLRIHTGERPYHCESCGKCFARADYLSKHLTTHIHNAPR